MLFISDTLSKDYLKNALTIFSMTTSTGSQHHDSVLQAFISIVAFASTNNCPETHEMVIRKQQKQRPGEAEIE
jgi:hypothetical protein